VVCDILKHMTNSLRDAVAVAEQLPESDQETYRSPTHGACRETPRTPRDIDGALRTLDAGEGRELNIHEVLSRRMQAANNARRLVWSPDAEHDLFDIWHHLSVAASAALADSLLRENRSPGRPARALA